MNHQIKVSLIEDLKRIKGGYRPKNHLFLLYNIMYIFVFFNLSITQLMRSYFHSIEDKISQNTHDLFAKNNNESIKINVNLRH